MIFLFLRDLETCYKQSLEDITEVCRSWRIAALTNRRLWSRILIYLQEYDYPLDYELCKRRLHRYLERSVAAPLSIEITLNTDFWPPHHNESMARIQSLIACISQELSRWASLSIDFEGGLHQFPFGSREDDLIKPLESLLRSPMPALRRLSLCGVRGSLEGCFPHVPSLNAFETKDCCTTNLDIPWSSLFSFRFSSNHFSSDSRHLLSLPECDRLKDLYIEGTELDTYKLGITFNCTLPNVVSFHLDSLPSREPVNICLANFRLPSLQNLTLVVPNAFWDRREDSYVPPYMTRAEMTMSEHIVGFAGTCKHLTLLWSETVPYHQWTDVSARYVTSRSVVIFDMFNGMPDLEELHLCDKISEVFLAVIKEEETLVPKLSRVFILDARGGKVPLQLEGIARRWQTDENRETHEVPSRYELC